MEAPEIAYFDEKSAGYQEKKNQLINFFESAEWSDLYKVKMQEMINKNSLRLILNINDLREYKEELSRQFIKAPMTYFAPWQAAFKDYLLKNFTIDKEKGAMAEQTYHLGVEGSFGGNKLTPRELLARHLGQLIQIEGIVTRCSIVRPKVNRTVSLCDATGNYSENVYHDAVSITGFPTSSVYPTKDDAGNPLTTEFGLSTYMDHQTIAIQEMPEKAPAGLLPRSIDVVMDNDLVDKCKPGDRVQIVGIYRALPRAGQGETSGIFRTVLIANSIKLIGRQTEQAHITEDDIAHIRTIAKRKDCFDILSRSVAPSIYGHNYIKKAIMLLLLGGVEKNLENGTHIRGDINLLMVGDPSTAKSQLLRFVLNVAPLAINTTGRGSSGAGLTAAVLHDKDSGERRLEAGAMVLADRGVVCIDEFDKMSDVDRVAIHEVMEQQTVTIAKAGIHMSLNARCSVVAAANPRYGQYISSEPPNANVNLPDSLLSRFDFLFIVLDHPDPEIDRAISECVLNNHRYLKKTIEGDDEDEMKDSDEPTKIFVTSEQSRGGRGRKGPKVDILNIPFLKKYIEYAKTTIHPKLTEKAANFIVNKYIELRQGSDEKPRAQPVTARALETLIRLSTAHAKARLSDSATMADCMTAVDILNFALDNDVQIIPKEKKDKKDDDDKKGGVGGSGGSGDGYDDDDDSKGDRRDDDGGDEGGLDRKHGKRQRTDPPPTSTARDGLRLRSKRQGGSQDLPSQGSEDSWEGLSVSHSQSTTSTSPQRRGKRKDRDIIPDSPPRTRSPPRARGGPRTPPRSPIRIETARVQDFQRKLAAHMRAKRLTEIHVEKFQDAINQNNPHPFSREEIEGILKKIEKDVMYDEQGVIHRLSS